MLQKYNNNTKLQGSFNNFLQLIFCNYVMWHYRNSKKDVSW